MVAPNENVIVVIQCRLCQKDQKLTVPAEGLRKRQAGALIQDAFPELSKGDRELFVSQTCGECWDKMFALEEEEGF